MRMSPIEQQMGRLMRAPDGHEGGDPPAAADPVADPAADPAADLKAQEKIDLGAADPKAADPADPADPKAADPADPKVDEPDARYGAPPEDQPYDIKLEGDIQLDKEAVELAAPALRELNLSNEGATKLIGVFAEKVLPHYEEQFTKNLESQIVTTRTEWEGAARDLIAGKNAAGEVLEAKNAAGEVLSFDDKDLKGVQSIAARVLDRYAPAGFREFLNETGLGVHPQMISFAYQVAKATAEDRDVESAATTKKEMSRTEKYYGPQS